MVVSAVQSIRQGPGGAPSAGAVKLEWGRFGGGMTAK